MSLAPNSRGVQWYSLQVLSVPSILWVLPHSKDIHFKQAVMVQVDCLCLLPGCTSCLLTAKKRLETPMTLFRTKRTWMNGLYQKDNCLWILGRNKVIFFIGCKISLRDRDKNTNTTSHGLRLIYKIVHLRSCVLTYSAFFYNTMLVCFNTIEPSKF